MLNEAVDGLNVLKDNHYIDCNLGGGGHTREILNRGGYVLGIDVDDNAIKHCESIFKSEIESGRLTIARGNFSNLKGLISKYGWDEYKIQGVLYDLGVSTFQLKRSSKGFSFEDDAELDMRMDSKLGVKAIDLIAVLSEADLAKLIFDYGEEPQAKIFASAIKQAFRSKGQDLKAKELAGFISKSSKYSFSRNNPATRVFQALRIAVNSELMSIEMSLGQATEVIEIGGRIVIISFHSLEDKISKNLITQRPGLKTLTKEPIAPTDDEVKLNPSSRSAKLRIYEKL